MDSKLGLIVNWLLLFFIIIIIVVKIPRVNNKLKTKSGVTEGLMLRPDQQWNLAFSLDTGH